MTFDIKNDKQNDRVKKLSVIRRFLAQVNILCILFLFSIKFITFFKHNHLFESNKPFEIT